VVDVAHAPIMSLAIRLGCYRCLRSHAHLCSSLNSAAEAGRRRGGSAHQVHSLMPYCSLASGGCAAGIHPVGARGAPVRYPRCISRNIAGGRGREGGEALPTALA
jgi:hypothetical protein